jgi:hypothetical protein
MTNNDLKELTNFLDKCHVNYKIVENRVQADAVKLANKSISKLPDSFGNLMCNDLSLSYNILTSLPDSFGNLICKRLFFSDNKLTQLPVNIGNLQCKYLYLHNNSLTSLPESIVNLKCKSLYLHNNPLTSKSKQLLEKLKRNGVFVIYQPTKQRTESQKKETLCISCGNQERTVDDTGRCESCRRDVYEADCFMCDFD